MCLFKTHLRLTKSKHKKEGIISRLKNRIIEEFLKHIYKYLKYHRNCNGMCGLPWEAGERATGRTTNISKLSQPTEREMI